MKGVEYCDELFRYEREFALLTPKERFERRQFLSKPLFDEFYSWMEGLCVLPKSMLGRAIRYAREQKKYIERYLTDGRLEISNNRAERSIKPYVIGRKNWLFCNTPAGARAGAVYYSIIVTAMENGLNPYEYLTWVLTQMPNLGSLVMQHRLTNYCRIVLLYLKKYMYPCLKKNRKNMLGRKMRNENRETHIVYDRFY